MKETQNNLEVNSPKESKKKFSYNELKNKKPADLVELAEKIGIEDPFEFKHNELVAQIIKTYVEKGHDVVVEGILEIASDANHGFLRFSDVNYKITPLDIFINTQKIRKWNIKCGDLVSAYIKVPAQNEKHFTISNLISVNNEHFEKLKTRTNFENLTPLYPKEKIKFEIDESSKENIVLRACDLIVPMGFGQRALIIAQPRTGKTVLMQNMAHAIKKNHPDVVIMALLIDERPEEVTEMARSLKGEVISSTFDEPAYRHIQIAELAIEKAKRMVELGKDVVIFLDSITRLARAYNTVTPSSGKVLSGGIDSNAMEGPKRIFGAARKTEEKGSLTIIGTALDKNKSQMDNYILQEFAGTGNCELFLDPNLGNRRIYPAIDITASGTRNEELLFKNELEINLRWAIRKIIIPMGPIEGMNYLLGKIKATKTNMELFQNMNK